VLPEDTKQTILQLLSRHERKHAAVLGSLRIVQQRQGWVSDQAVIELANLFGLTPSEIDSIATAYSKIFRRSVGRHVILLCDSVSCFVTGYAGIREHLEQLLGVGFGGTTSDGRFTLLPVACLGACDHAPAMMVDQDLHGDLTCQKATAILNNYE
jgi:NADH-quinone oxidoreductase subunit E